MKRLFRPSRIITHDETVEVINEGQVVFVDGKPVKKDITCFFLTCNVQPVNGRDLLLVPEGDRYKEQYWIFTNELEKPLVVNQRVHRLGVNFQVQTVEQWGSYQRARIMRTDTGPNKTP